MTTSTWVVNKSGPAIQETYSEIQPHENYWPWIKELPSMIRLAPKLARFRNSWQVREDTETEK
jgi:hypothetical protein